MSTQDERKRKPALALIGLLVALIMVGVLAAVFVPKIIRRRREAAVARAFDEILASPARAEELLATSPDLVNVRDRWGDTLLHEMARQGHMDVAELLLANGADVNARDNQGQTPLAVAKKRGYTELVELLKKHGAKESK